MNMETRFLIMRIVSILFYSAGALIFQSMKHRIELNDEYNNLLSEAIVTVVFSEIIKTLGELFFEPLTIISALLRVYAATLIMVLALKIKKAKPLIETV